MQSGGLFSEDARATAPSRQRQNFGLLIDLVEEKLLSKPIIQAILSDRPDYRCVPIALSDDLQPYARLGMKVIIQKVNVHVNPEKTSPEKFEED